MTLSPKTLLAITATSILMVGASFASAQEATQEAPAAGAVETLETLETTETTEAPKVEIFTREAVEGAVAETEEDVTVDAETIDALSETVIPAEEIAPEAEEATEELAEEATEEMAEPK